jgi:hypothetical protein
MKTPSPQHLKQFALHRYHLGPYLRRPGDGRRRPQIPAEALLWSQIIGQVLREGTFHGVEALVRSSARSHLGVVRPFGDDALAYFTERLDSTATRRVLLDILRQAKRKKAFQAGPLGLAIDGTDAASTGTAACALCRPTLGPERRLLGYHHAFSMISVVGVGLSLPFDVEPYGSGDSEYAASQRLLQRAIEGLGPRFALYVVADGEYATAPWLHLVGDLGLHAVSRLKANLPELYAAAQARFAAQPPRKTWVIDGDTVELWDADDFDPWETLRWITVRVLRYRQHKPDGTIQEAYWLTDFSPQQVDSRALYQMAKSRWEIENQGFNEGKTFHQMEHITHHHENSLLLNWLLIVLTLTLERLYRLRYLHRGSHPPYAAVDLLRLLRLSLSQPRPPDTS